MGLPAATVGCHHTCPQVSSKRAHEGGPIASGSSNVLIAGIPAAREGDVLVCIGPPDSIAAGSGSVLINGKPAARQGELTRHGGKVVTGNPTVLIG